MNRRRLSKNSKIRNKTEHFRRIQGENGYLYPKPKLWQYHYGNSPLIMPPRM